MAETDYISLRIKEPNLTYQDANMDIAQLRSLHAEILNTLNKIELGYHPDFQCHTDEISQYSMLLCSKVKSLIDAADHILYPAVNNGDFVAHIAHRYQSEIRKISKDFLRFAQFWDSAEKIKRAPIAFLNDAKPIFEALKHRIHCERTEIFPKVELLYKHPIAAPNEAS